MKRREFTAYLGAGALAFPLRGFAQTAERHYRVGWLGSTAHSFTEPYGLEFVRRLKELGFPEGTVLSIERREGGGNVQGLSELAAELAALKCDIFFGGGPEA